MGNDSLNVFLTIDGTSYEKEEVVITNPSQPLSELIKRIIQGFQLPKISDEGIPIQYLISLGEDEEIVLEFEDEEGCELCLLDYNIQPGDNLHVLSIPVRGYSATIDNPTPPREAHEESFIVYLTIEGTEYEDVDTEVVNPMKTIREQINSIIEVFNLPKMDNGGNPLTYLLGRMEDDSDFPFIFEFDDPDGHEQTIIDYNVQPGDHLHVLSIPVRGYSATINNPTPPTEAHEEFFFVYLTIEGSFCENVGVQIKNPLMSIREQINWIVQVFNLSNIVDGGYPIQYFFGKNTQEGDNLELLEFYNEEGRELCLLDYNVQPGDHLHLFFRYLAGGLPITFDPAPKGKRNYLGQLIERIKTKKQNVYSSIFAPTNVKPFSHMIVQVYLHLYEETERVKALAQESQLNAERRDYIPLQCKLKKGDKVDVRLNIYGETLLMSEKKNLVWQGSFTKCSFDYFVPSNIKTQTLSCCAILSVDNMPVGEMRFITKVTEYTLGLNPEVYSRQYKKIFISYAHQDEDKVEPMARAYKAQGVDYFFDRHYLKPGDIFPLKIQEYIDTADLFILCWSENAAKSEYVELERKRALERAFPQVIPIEEAKLTIYPMSIEPRAELPADMKDTYNFEIV